jgi:hypothetical protein
VTAALAVGAALAVLCVLLVALPFLREPKPRDDRLAVPDEVEQRRLSLAEDRDRALAALKELEFDHRTGKVSDDDYRALVIPLRRKADVIGVLTLEFSPGQKLGPQAATGLAVAADLLAPQLYDRYQNDRWLITKTGISIREGVKMATGPKHWVAKLIIIGSILALLVLMDWVRVPFAPPSWGLDLRIPYRVSARFAFAPVERR